MATHVHRGGWGEIVCTTNSSNGTVTLSDIFGSADLGERPLHFCYRHQVARILEKNGMRMNRKGLLLLLRRVAVLRKIRLQGEDMVVKRD
jgi:hypothetical protein